MYRKLKIIFISLICVISLILISIPISSMKNNDTQMLKTQNNFINNFSSNIIEMLDKVNKSKLRNHIQNIQNFGPHPTGSEALKHVGEYIYNELNKTNLPVEYVPWKSEKRSGENIVSTLKGIGDSDRIIIVCAHYDSISISPGADDDGSGVSIVLMLAEILSSYAFNSTIKFILFSGEEQGKLGSNYYAQTAKINNDNIIGVLALDKVGYAITAEEGKKVIHHSNKESSWMVDVSKEMAKKYFEYIQLEVIAWSEDSGSDHQAFVDNGFHGTDFVRYSVNPFYHTSEDKIEHMNMTYLTKVCNLTLATLVKIASLKSVLKNDDLKIIMKGTILFKEGQIYVKIVNNNHEMDTANVSINISLKHIFRNNYVSAIKKHYKIPCSWQLTKEIEEIWEFLIAGRKFTRGLFKFEVILKGINDDIHLYKKQTTYGWIINPLKVVMIPKL
ncbi:hypothetical protein AYK24_08025 [Thermoplasmatales archaeon SG8-52-4]|nr:MAG: hypothetical protein AYK24_08025 [Thermoplasmatales archaeon SG8-52-4]